MFERLNAQVEERVPAERLLVYDVKQGWEPLCEFLGVEPPKDEPFPHLNDTFRKLVRRRSTLVYAMLAVAALLVASAVLFLRKRPIR